MEKLFGCCGKEWSWKDVGFLGNSVTSDKMVFCALCGNFKRKTEGQLDVEEVWQWLGICNGKEGKIRQLTQQIDDLTNKRDNILIEYYKNL